MAWRVPLRSTGARILAAALAALVVAELAVLVLAPGQPGPMPLEVDPGTFVDPAILEEAEAFQAEARTLSLAALAIELVALTAMALGRPAALRRGLQKLERRPWLAAAAAGAAVSIVLATVTLPTGLLALDARVDAGLSVQDAGGWLFDRLRSALIAALIAAAGALLLVGLQRRLPRAWWLAGAGVVAAYALVLSFLAPVLLAPVFNDFEPIGEGRTRADVVALADRAGVEIGDVYRIDASSRSTTVNAYVDGIGSTRRVVLYDNLLDEAGRDELGWVVAHELAHVKQRDIGRGILFVALVSIPGMLVVRELGGALAARTGARPGTATAVPAYALAIAVTALGLGIAGNQLSREVEERADRIALELTGDPAAMVALQQISAERNLSDPDPPALWQALFSTHPSKSERFGLAEAYRRGSQR